MPELPEIEAYLHALRPRIVGSTIDDVRVASFSLLKTYDPPVDALVGQSVAGVHRIGKRISIDCSDGLHCVIHLMVAGRFKWSSEPKPIPKRGGLVSMDFSTGSLLLTEAGTKRRASMSILRDEDLDSIDPGGIEIGDASLDEFASALQTNRHTLKRALTDARYLSGIGGAFADEILFRSRLSPTQMNMNLSDEEMSRHSSKLQEQPFPNGRRNGSLRPATASLKKVTAFHSDMAVHGKFGEECRVCGAPIQRIVAGRERNQLLPRMSDGWPDPRGQITQPLAEGRLAEDHR